MPSGALKDCLQIERRNSESDHAIEFELRFCEANPGYRRCQVAIYLAGFLVDSGACRPPRSKPPDRAGADSLRLNRARRSLDRLESGLRFLHLLFNEGCWSSDDGSSPNRADRADLCRVGWGLS